MHEERILITGLGGPAGRSALEYFSERGFTKLTGCDVREVDERRRVESFHLVPLAADAAYAGALLNIIRDEEARLLVPTVTEELVTVSRMRPEIEAAGCAVFISPPEGTEIANDKSRTARFLRERGLRTPLTVEGTPREALEAIGLPVLAKPVFSRGGRGVVVYRTEAALLEEKRDGIIFQEFVPGEEYDVNLFIEDTGEVSAAVALRKTEMKGGEVGNALRVERSGCAPALKLAVDSSIALGLTGPLDVDVRMDGDGEPVVLEINARIGGNVSGAVEVLDSLTNAWMKKQNRIKREKEIDR